MTISLDNLYRSEFSFLPARGEKGSLESVDIITSFANAHGDIHMSTELVPLRMSDGGQYRLFVEKLELIKTCQHLFIQRKVSAWVNLAPAIVNTLLSDTGLTSQVERFSFLGLTINENYPELNKGKDNPILATLVAQFPLVLTNYGPGDILTRVIFDGLFECVVLDKNSVRQRIAHISFEPFTRAILAQLSLSHEPIIISGTDTQETLERVLPVRFSVMQGGLWPTVLPVRIVSLVRM